MSGKVKAPQMLMAAAIFLGGCDTAEIGRATIDQFDLPKPSVWMVPDGKQVDIGDEVVSILATDQCNIGFGDAYPCWKFSLKDGDTQPVMLSNGIKEIWTTVDAGGDKVYLVRPNGFKVIGK